MRRIGLGNPLKTVSNYSGTTGNGDHHSVPSDEEMRQLEELSKREGLTVEQIVRLSINDFIDHPDDSFRAAARLSWRRTPSSIVDSRDAQQKSTQLAV